MVIVVVAAIGVALGWVAREMVETRAAYDEAMTRLFRSVPADQRFYLASDGQTRPLPEDEIPTRWAR